MGKIYQVFVMGFKGEKITLDISQSETEFNEMKVLKFKEKLQERLPGQSVSAEDLRLLFANKQLEDQSKFSDYEIKDKSTIMMVLRLPGGML
ncbi:uncharacterized protein [Heptranchias perlo]|uniref:uncharacterized protein n=1 Tax=Heptranchias perlo TaxID=212740 RepID=UPI00355A2504